MLMLRVPTTTESLSVRPTTGILADGFSECSSRLVAMGKTGKLSFSAECKGSKEKWEPVSRKADSSFPAMLIGKEMRSVILASWLAESG